ncbi:MAG: hypothetical protein WBB76_06560 [Gaiellaceae bacterium]
MTASASCPAGKALLGGGGTATNNESPEASFLNQSFPFNATTWRVVGVVATDLSSSKRMTVQAWAVCAA